MHPVISVQIKKQDITSNLYPQLFLEKTGAYGDGMDLPGNWLPWARMGWPSTAPTPSGLVKLQLPGVEEKMWVHAGLARRFC